MSTSRRDYTKVWVNGTPVNTGEQPGTSDHNPTRIAKGGMKQYDYGYSDFSSMSGHDSSDNEEEEPDQDHRPRRRASRSPTRPPSEASSYGSTDSGLSHPPRTWEKKTKKKKVVRFVRRPSTRRTDSMRDTTSERAAQQWRATSDPTDDTTPRPRFQEPVAPSSIRDSRNRRETSAALDRSRDQPRNEAAERRRRTPPPGDDTPRPVFQAPVAAPGNKAVSSAAHSRTVRSQRFGAQPQRSKHTSTTSSDTTAKPITAVPVLLHSSRDHRATQESKTTGGVMVVNAPPKVSEQRTRTRHRGSRRGQAARGPTQPPPPQSRIPVRPRVDVHEPGPKEDVRVVSPNCQSRKKVVSIVVP